MAAVHRRGGGSCRLYSRAAARDYARVRLCSCRQIARTQSDAQKRSMGKTDAKSLGISC